MADGIRYVTKGIGPNFGQEIIVAGLGGKKIWWISAGPDSIVNFEWSFTPTGNQLSTSDVSTLDGVIDAHSPSTPFTASDNDQLLEQIINEKTRLKSYPRHIRTNQDYDIIINKLKTLISGGV